MFSKDLEYTIGQCYKRAREARHEFMTVEHLLLALLDNPSAEAVLKACGADFAAPARATCEQAIADLGAGAAGRRRPRHPAHAGLPARAAARRLPRAVLGQEGSHRRQRAGGDLRREGFARGLLPQPAGHQPPGRRQLPLARHRQGTATTSAAHQDDSEAASGEAATARARATPLAEFASQPQRARARRQDRPAGRPRRRSRAHHPGAVPPAQEQPAVRRRGRRGQDRARRGPGQAHRRRRRARSAGRRDHLSRSTWARWSPAPSTAATSRSA